MTTLIILKETYIQDGKGGKRLVRSGDKVELKLISPTKRDREHFEFLEKWLGRGPFIISWIGIWPCGRVMLYLKTTGGEPGAYASDFM
ncbi:MAG: hypothetical protein Q8N59_02760 [bacterium]|nr:hypothetical protein [bacterium]